jgi:hypothetical protein
MKKVKESRVELVGFEDVDYLSLRCGREFSFAVWDCTQQDLDSGDEGLAKPRKGRKKVDG